LAVHLVWDEGIMVYPTIVHVTKRLRQIAHGLDKHSKFIQEKFNVTIPQLICLWEISKRGPVPLGELTKNIFLNKSTVTGIVDRLERRNFVRRTRISQDRRQIHVEITEEGLAFLDMAPTPLQENFSRKFKELEESERIEIMRAIDRIVELMNGQDVTIE
jgi:DNA-binding MarR family transcriptional regulator